MRSIFILIVFFGHSALAQQLRNHRWDLTAGFGDNIPMSSTGYSELESGQANHYSVGYGYTTDWTFELGYEGFDFDSSNAKGKSYHAGARYYFVDSNLTPYAIMGLSSVETTISNTKTTALGAIAGLGIEWTLCRYISIGAEFKALYASQSYKEDPKKDGSVAVMPNAFIRIHTPWDSSNVKKSEPVAIAAAKLPAPKLDTDGDGIADENDKCPATAAGVVVNTYGCAASEKANLQISVEFNSGKAEVLASFSTELQRLAEFMKKNPRTTAEINGYTDNVGNEKLNLSLSQKRADAIRTALIKDHGIAAERLLAKGYGPQNPIASNATLKGRQQNRRVIAVISEK